MESQKVKEKLKKLKNLPIEDDPISQSKSISEKGCVQFKMQPQKLQSKRIRKRVNKFRNRMITYRS